jgi:hypothetical protein
LPRPASKRSLSSVRGSAAEGRAARGQVATRARTDESSVTPRSSGAPLLSQARMRADTRADTRVRTRWRPPRRPRRPRSGARACSNRPDHHRRTRRQRSEGRYAGRRGSRCWRAGSSRMPPTRDSRRAGVRPRPPGAASRAAARRRRASLGR